MPQETQTFNFTDLFGPTLKTKSGEQKTSAILNGKTVLVYFSAHWCPPCRGFTPTLSKFYTDLKSKRDDFEIVFVSSDRDEKSFNEYFDEMTFLAVPYAERDVKDKLSKKYKVQGIPSLVVLGPDGEIITKDGRSKVSEDTQGENFPWKPKPFDQILPAKVMGKDGAEVDTKSLDDKVLMLYFSAHWCPPCRGYTPELGKVYKELKKQGKDMELIFASSDRDEKSFNEYYDEMPWLALKYEDRAAKEELSNLFEVSGIPTLVVLDKVGSDGKRNVISTSGRPTMDTVGDFPWHPTPYGNISEGVECDGMDINEEKALIVLCENADDDEQKDIKDLIKKLAVEHKANRKDGDDVMLYFYGDKPTGPLPRVRELCGLKDDGEITMLLLDLPDNGGYYVADLAKYDDEVTEESVRNFLQNKGERKQLGGP